MRGGGGGRRLRFGFRRRRERSRLVHEDLELLRRRFWFEDGLEKMKKERPTEK